MKDQPGWSPFGVLRRAPVSLLIPMRRSGSAALLIPMRWSRSVAPRPLVVRQSSPFPGNQDQHDGEGTMAHSKESVHTAWLVQYGLPAKASLTRGIVSSEPCRSAVTTL